MTQTRTEIFPLTDGSKLRVTVAEPESARRGGLVVLHEARGMTDAVRGLVTGLAEEGWLTVAPHLYHRDGPDEYTAGDQRVADQVRRLSGDSVLADTDASFVWLAEQGVRPDQMGIVGFDLGGSAALVVAASRTLGAAVTVAGGGITAPLSDGLPALLDVVGEVGCPWLGIYGGQDDIPADEVELLSTAAGRARFATEVVGYPHTAQGFDGSTEVAAEAWQRTLNWLDAHLR
ncbi:carboxymethylenebutenolidase [Pseudonocardiaceae bacterium YIM PH 21723]|nr:carboxymethylenebutenolidase [Pseudonocardiaceae bacterium YIM PH 21723]